WQNTIGLPVIRHPEVAAKGNHRASADGVPKRPSKDAADAPWPYPSRLAALAPQDDGDKLRVKFAVTSAPRNGGLCPPMLAATYRGENKCRSRNSNRAK